MLQLTISKCTRWIVDYQQQFFLPHSAYSYNATVRRHGVTDHYDNQMTGNHIIKLIYSDIDINEQPEKIWENITNVKIEQFSDPIIFKLLDIPKPLKAEIISEGRRRK